jgi:two-component system, OmpR family, response regulator MprA
MAPHILVVDDHPALRDALRIMLEDDGYRVSLAADGRTALALVAGDRPDLVLTDVEMPGMDGLELRRALALAGESVPVMFMSGSVDARALAAAHGAVAALTKPFSIDELLALVARLTRRAAA